MNLKKQLNLLDVFCIASGAMISSGIFILPGLAFARTGPSVFISYFLAGALALTGMVSTIELTTAMPKAGGNYFFTTRSLGPGVGTIAGLLSWFSLGLKSAFALIGMSSFTAAVLPYDIRLVAIALCLAFTVLNLVGVKEAGRFTVFMVLALMALMLVYVVHGFGAFRLDYMEPFTTAGAAGVFGTAGFVFVSYGGLLHIASVAEEIKDPKRNIPRGMILSLVVVGIAYSFMVFVTAGVLDPETYAASLTPISDGAEVFMGTPGRIALSIAAILAFVSTANAGLLSASRYLFALARDQLLPGFFAGVSKRFHIPHWAVLVTGGFMILILLLPLETIAESASVVLMLTYILSNLSVIILRESRVVSYQPSFRSPLYPWVQILGSIGFTVLIAGMGVLSLAVTLALITGGVLVYWFYGRNRANSEFALLNIIERVFNAVPFLQNRETSTAELESELRHIIHDRDEVREDRVDRVVHAATVLDLDESMSKQAFFCLIAEQVAEKVGLDNDRLCELLVEREELSSTALNDFVAIPHVVMPGNNAFHLVIVRNKQEVIFETDDGAAHVRAVFVLFGTRDQRNLHLQVLASVAQIVHNPEFRQKWLAAVDSNALRNLVLATGRYRRREQAQHMGPPPVE